VPAPLLRGCGPGTVGATDTRPIAQDDEELRRARSRVRQLVDAMGPHDEVEAAHQREVLAWIDRGDPLWRTAKPATPPEHLVAYAVLVDPDRRAVLLVDHRDAGRWLPTGGHVEPGEDPADAAARELIEELGVPPVPLTPGPLLLTRTTTIGVSAGHVDVSLWFAFVGSPDDDLRPDPDEIGAVRWWPFDSIRHGPGTRFDPHLPRFVDALVAGGRRGLASGRSPVA
jgi:8-oxo-dGTP pyrophosphatase MutT (NUDIX family)